MKKTSKALASTAALCLVLSTSSVFAAENTAVAPERLSGANRVDTAVKIAEKSFNEAWKGQGNAILSAAADANLVDSLAVAPLSYQLKAPILLNDAKDSINADTLKALKANNVKTVYIATGEGVISNKAKAQLEKEGFKVERLGGKNRYETAKNILDTFKKNGGDTKNVALVSGNGLADALSVAPEAARKGMPILLTDGKDAVAANLAEVAKAADTVYAIGGNGIISDALVQQLKADRVSGHSRYETNAAVIKKFAGDKEFSKIYLGNGQDGHLVDSLTGSVLAAQSGSPIVLADKNLADATKDALKGKVSDQTGVVALGGEAVVSDNLVKEVTNIANESPEYVAAEKAVKAYEDAKITTAEEITAAKALKAPAVKAIEAVKDQAQKDALNARIAAKDKAISEAEAKMQLKVESVKALNATQMQVTFTKAVKESSVIESAPNKDTLVDGAIKIEKVATASNSVDADASKAVLSEDGKVLTITTDKAMNGEYVVSVVKDKILSKDTNKIEYVEEYTSPVINVKDEVAPKINSVEKISSTQYKVKFSEPIANVGTLKAVLADGKDVTADITQDKTSLIKGELVLTLGGTYTNKDVNVTLIGTKDFAGNLITPNPASFTVKKGELDGTKPTVSAITVATPEKFEIKFSEEVQKFDVDKIVVDGTALVKDSDSVEQDKTDKTKYIVKLNTILSAGFHTVSINAGDIKDLSGEEIDAFSKAVEVKKDAVGAKLTSATVNRDGKDGKEYLVIKFDKDVTLDKIDKANLNSTGLEGKAYKDYVTRNVTIKTSAADKEFVPVADGVKNEYKIALADLVIDGTPLVKDEKYTLDLPESAVKNLTGEANLEQKASIIFTRSLDTVVSGQEVDNVITNQADVTTGTAAGKDDTLKNSEVRVVFKTEVDGATATTASNYVIDGATVKKAELASDKKTVKLTLEDNKTSFSGDRYITVNGVKTKDGLGMKEAFKKVITLNENIAPTVTAVDITAVDTATKKATVKISFSEAVSNAGTDDFKLLIDGVEEAGNIAEVAELSAGSEAKDLVITITVDNADKLSKGLTLKADSSKLNIKDVAGNVLNADTIKIK